MDVKAKLEGIKDLVDDGREFADTLKGALEARPDGELTEAQRKVLEKLLARAESAVETSKELAAAQRDHEIAQLDTRIADLEFASTLDLPAANRTQVRRRLRRLRARRARLTADRFSDFDGLLDRHEVAELTALMTSARKEVGRKRKLAQVIGTVLKLTDIGLTIVGKAGGLVA